MQEILPVLIGITIGAVSYRIGSMRLRAGAAAALSLSGGFLAMAVNGEWGLGITAMLADTAFVAGGALASIVILAALAGARRRLAGNPLGS
jgi:hypothetical protein